MASLAGANYYAGGTWKNSSWYTGTGYGWMGFGNGSYLILKITAATASESLSGRFRIQVPMYCASSMTYYVNCAVTTTAPSFSGAPTAPSNYSTWTAEVSASYTMQTFYTPTVTITSGGTYYVWLWSTSSTVCYHAHHSNTGYITAVGYTAPTVSLSGYKGYYSGCTLSVGNTSYGNIYVSASPSGTFWRKATSGTSVSIDADTSSTSKTFYIIRTDTDLGESFGYYGGMYTEYAVPRFACAVYDGSSSYTVKTGNSGTITCSKSGYTFKGLATSASSASYSALSFSSSTNGGVYYAVYTQSTTVTYYRGSSTAYYAYPYRYLYGTGSYTSWALTEPTRTCASNSAYTFQGWSTSASSTSTSYSTLAAARIGGYTTVYGVYKKDASSSSSTVYYYRGSSTKNSVTKTTSVAAAYYYGKGSTSGGGTSVSYGTVTSTCASDSSAALVGWTTSSSSTSSSYSSATAAFDAGNSTIYGIFKKSGSSANSTVYYYAGTPTKNSVTKTTTVADKYYYGAGSTSGGGTTYSYGTITTDVSGWTFLGFTTSSTTTNSTSTAASLFNAGNSTIYGTYSKTEAMTYIPNNGEGAGLANVTNYLYGTGQTTAYRPAEPLLGYAWSDNTTGAEMSYTLVGWGTSATDTTPDTWNSLWDAGTRTVYAIWIPDNNVYYGVDGVWVPVELYYGVNDRWVPAYSKYGTVDTWK